MSDFKLKYSLTLVHSFIFVILCCGYLIFYGSGQDILALELITTPKSNIYWNPIEFIVNNMGFINHLFNAPVSVGIILQIFGAFLNF